jgi:hypothetical protein
VFSRAAGQPCGFLFCTVVATSLAQPARAGSRLCLLVISHDRYFLDRTVGRILALEDGHITEYPGGYSDYVAKRVREKR